LRHQETLALFNKWNLAIQSGNIKTVSSLYARDAILLPTLSNQVRTNHKEYESYFSDFLANSPRAQLEQSNIRTFTDITIHSGIYHFTFADQSQVKARFTFVYHKIDNQWLIVEHHSSSMPH